LGSIAILVVISHTVLDEHVLASCIAEETLWVSVVLLMFWLNVLLFMQPTVSKHWSKQGHPNRDEKLWSVITSLPCVIGVCHMHMITEV